MPMSASRTPLAGSRPFGRRFPQIIANLHSSVTPGDFSGPMSHFRLTTAIVCHYVSLRNYVRQSLPFAALDFSAEPASLCMP